LAFGDAFAPEMDDRRERYGAERYVLLGMVQQRLLAVAHTFRGDRIRIITARPTEPFEQRLYHGRTAKRGTRGADTTFDRSLLDAMTKEQRHAAAMSDADARPITEEDLATGRVRLVPRVCTLRRVLRLSQEEFATRCCIPTGTLRDWEQGRKAPDAAARAYPHSQSAACRE
jgi:putative transcriptional regulator